MGVDLSDEVKCKIVKADASHFRVDISGAPKPELGWPVINDMMGWLVFHTLPADIYLAMESEYQKASANGVGDFDTMVVTVSLDIDDLIHQMYQHYDGTSLDHERLKMMRDEITKALCQYFALYYTTGAGRGEIIENGTSYDDKQITLAIRPPNSFKYLPPRREEPALSASES